MKALESLLFSLADDDFIIGYRNSEWTGVAPIIEEDIAFSSIAQDEIGHARAIYELLEIITKTSADHLAYGRQPHEYLNCQLVEHPREDWGFTIARQYLYDMADAIRIQTLKDSSYQPLADILNKIEREERYHLIHTKNWIEKLANSDKSRTKLELGLQKAWPLALGVFEIVSENELLAESILKKPSIELENEFKEEIKMFLAKFGLTLDDKPATSSGHRGQHTTAFSTLWSEMTLVYRQDPEAVW